MHISYILVILVIFLESVHGLSRKNLIDSPLLTRKIGGGNTIVVDANGEGDFKTVQAAIDHVPTGNHKWMIIHIKKGVYREKVKIPSDKPYVYLRGDGRGKTSIVWSHSTENNHDSATFRVEAPHFIAFGISFKNTAAHSNASTKSVAAVVEGDKASFYHCGFFSNRNTLFDSKGRHYYDNCYIQGTIDFIFGQGHTMFHDCEVFVKADWKTDVKGSITAHYRDNHNDTSGFVFVKGKVYGIKDVYLGRAHGPHSRVLFANTYLSKSVTPHGWTNSSYSGTTDNLYQAEYKCHGPGSGSKERAHWSKQLNDEEAAPFITVDFIKGREWLPAWF